MGIRISKQKEMWERNLFAGTLYYFVFPESIHIWKYSTIDFVNVLFALQQSKITEKSGVRAALQAGVPLHGRVGEA